MSRFTPLLCALLIPLACGGTTNSNDGNDGATNVDDSDDATGGTGGITNHPDGGMPNTGGRGPGIAECSAHEATRESLSEASECVRQGTHCNYGGGYHSMCENVVVALDPPVSAAQGKLVVETDTTGPLPISDYDFCTESMCAIASPSAQSVEQLALQLTSTDNPHLEGDVPFPTTLTLTLSDENSGETIQARTVPLEYSCGIVGDRWCWTAAPLTVDLSVTSFGGSAP